MNHLAPALDRASSFVLVFALVALLGGVAPAAAHVALVSSDPPDAGVLESLPSRAVLVFTEEVREVHELTVSGPDGSVTNGEPSAVGPEVRQNLWAGPEGSYVMSYDVVARTATTSSARPGSWSVTHP